MFEGVSSATLQAIASALRSGQLTMPLSKIGLARIASRCPLEAIDQMVGLSADGLQPRHLALLLEQCCASSEAALASAAELVWTGPESAAAASRDTAVVLEELFGSATRSVVVSTFVVHQGHRVFKALSDRMAAVPSLQVQLFLHIGREQRDTRYDSEIIREFVEDFSRHWPWSPRPRVFYDPRSLAQDDATRATWHAKCVVIDDEVAFVTSANFTEWAQSKNVEAGVLVRNVHFARQLRHQFESLVQSRAVLEVPGLADWRIA